MAVGIWFSIISNINETTLLALGKPVYAAIGNSLKLCYLLIGLPIGFAEYGALGLVVVVATADIYRYFPILLGQIREQFSFLAQDLFASLMMFAFVSFWVWVRWL